MNGIREIKQEYYEKLSKHVETGSKTDSCAICGRKNEVMEIYYTSTDIISDEANVDWFEQNDMGAVAVAIGSTCIKKIVGDNVVEDNKIKCCLQDCENEKWDRSNYCEEHYFDANQESVKTLTTIGIGCELYEVDETTIDRLSDLSDEDSHKFNAALQKIEENQTPIGRVRSFHYQ